MEGIEKVIKLSKKNTFPEKLLSSKIRRDISISEASIYGKPIFVTAPNSRAVKDYSALTEEILKRILNRKILRDKDHGKIQRSIKSKT